MIENLACLPTASATAPDDTPRVAAVPERRASISDVAHCSIRRVPGDAPGAAAGDAGSCSERRCLWCRSPLEVGFLRWCSKKCRQTAFRCRQLFTVDSEGDTPKRLRYADPPYIHRAHLYRDQPTFAGEVDHAELVSRMEGFDGWAISCAGHDADRLAHVVSLCPPGVRVAPWVKPNGVSSKTRGPHNTWEAIVYKPARLRRPGFRDYLSAKPARGGGTLIGRKPLAFCAFLFQLLGASPMDELDDLFPGTGIVGRAFAEFKRASLGTRGEAPSLEASIAPRRSAPAASPGDEGVARAGASDVADDSSGQRRRPSTSGSPRAAQDWFSGGST
jgi:hypothetical protein